MRTPRNTQPFFWSALAVVFIYMMILTARDAPIASFVMIALWLLILAVEQRAIGREQSHASALEAGRIIGTILFTALAERCGGQVEARRILDKGLAEQGVDCSDVPMPTKD